ncbi:hypothetical protein VTL71DRAFT_11220 [Oculimacula yallundae]|uniref:MutL C-terminal dimerisation domain-containing protein n=1 Tax=Oculimacula yallundae TaxID=86028 RepID=A0ABR4CXV6_9HELO
MSIQPLPPDVIAQIRSSITITSLNGVICELVKNSLDADAKKIDISVDYARGSCSVEDDGVGILPSEFRADGHLGKLHHTSKLNAQTELHGGRGTFLASLSAMALVSITSHHHLHRSQNALTLHKSEIVSRQTPAPLQQQLTSKHGTRVTVRDLFGNMPVRVKHRALIAEKEKASSKDWERLKRDIISLLLPWPKPVAVSIRESQSNHKMNLRPSSLPFQSGRLSVSSLCSILAQASMIDHQEKDSWISVHASTPSLDIGGAISLDPVATKQIQFMSVGIEPILSTHGQSVFHDEINRLFANSAFGIEEQGEEINTVESDRRAKDGRYRGDGYTGKELKGVKKGVDRWPMFFIRIQSSSPQISKAHAEDLLDGKTQSLVGIMEVLQAMILEFLTKNLFRSKSSRGPRNRADLVGGVSENSMPETDSIFSIPPQTDKDSRSHRKKFSKITHKPNVLGINVRLPSFRRGVVATERTFDSWARVKRGNVSRPITPKIPIASTEGLAISRPSTAPPSLTGTSTSSRSIMRGVQVKPLVSKDGKIVRAPFEDVASPAKPMLLLPASTPAPGLEQEVSSEPEDDIVTWINPITKVESMINQRTGLTVRATTASSHVSQQPRLTTSQPSRTSAPAQPSPWISDMLKKWENPIFAPAEPSIPQISFEGPDSNTQCILHGHHHHCTQIDIDRAFKESSSGTHGAISKTALGLAEVVAQVDGKFILVKIRSNGASTGDNDEIMLVLIDQHAADERIRVEALMKELCSPPLPQPRPELNSGILTTTLEKPLNFDLSTKETNLLQTYQVHFANWGILYRISTFIPTSTIQRLTVHALPPAIVERCQISPRLLVDLIRTELWTIHSKISAPPPSLPPGDWLRRIHTCPQGLLDMINSRACRSAIMFNDVLSMDQCQILVKRLAMCKFPFQCAHGRPSLVPLVDLRGLRVGGWAGDSDLETGSPEGSFARCFARWQHGMVDKST